MHMSNNGHNGADLALSVAGTARDDDRIPVSGVATPDQRALAVGDDEAITLRAEIARLETRQRHLQKDIVVKDAYLAALRADLFAKEAENARLQESMARLHASFARTLSQPRYRAADAVNRVLHRFEFLHTLVKRGVTARHDPPSA